MPTNFRNDLDKLSKEYFTKIEQLKNAAPSQESLRLAHDTKKLIDDIILFIENKRASFTVNDFATWYKARGILLSEKPLGLVSLNEANTEITEKIFTQAISDLNLALQYYKLSMNLYFGKEQIEVINKLVQIYNALCFLYQNSNPDKVFHYSEETRKLFSLVPKIKSKEKLVLNPEFTLYAAQMRVKILYDRATFLIQPSTEPVSLEKYKLAWQQYKDVQQLLAYIQHHSTKHPEINVSLPLDFNSLCLEGIKTCRRAITGASVVSHVVSQQPSSLFQPKPDQDQSLVMALRKNF